MSRALSGFNVNYKLFLCGLARLFLRGVSLWHRAPSRGKMIRVAQVTTSPAEALTPSLALFPAAREPGSPPAFPSRPGLVWRTFSIRGWRPRREGLESIPYKTGRGMKSCNWLERQRNKAEVCLQIPDISGLKRWFRPGWAALLGAPWLSAIPERPEVSRGASNARPFSSAALWASGPRVRGKRGS